jgi:hypothetical protein
MVFARMALGVTMIFGAAAHLWGQELRVQCQPEQQRVLFGEPVYATYRITNDSSTPVYIGAVEECSGKVVVLRYKAWAVGPRGKVPVREGFDEPKARFRLDPGKEVLIQQPLPITDVTLPELPEGEYELRFVIPYSLQGDGGVWEKLESCISRFSVLPAQGPDAGWLEALQQAARAAEKKQLRRPSADSPLNWHEVLEGTVEGIVPKLLTRFPTSTYAGYVLVKQGPGGSLRAASVLTPEEGDRLWYVPVTATEAQKEERRKTSREGYAWFVREAQAFLTAHPDFSQKALLQKEIANALFYQGRYDEAWLEVEALAKLEGPWADEARECLKGKDPVEKR